MSAAFEESWAAALAAAEQGKDAAWTLIRWCEDEGLDAVYATELAARIAAEARPETVYVAALTGFEDFYPLGVFSSVAAARSACARGLRERRHQSRHDADVLEAQDIADGLPPLSIESRLQMRRLHLRARIFPMTLDVHTDVFADGLPQ